MRGRAATQSNLSCDPLRPCCPHRLKVLSLKQSEVRKQGPVLPDHGRARVTVRLSQGIPPHTREACRPRLSIPKIKQKESETPRGPRGGSAERSSPARPRPWLAPLHHSRPGPRGPVAGDKPAVRLPPGAVRRHTARGNRSLRVGSPGASQAGVRPRPTTTTGLPPGPLPARQEEHRTRPPCHAGCVCKRGPNPGGADES